MDKLSRTCSKRPKPHLATAKRVLRYLKGCPDCGNTFKKEVQRIEMRHLQSTRIWDLLWVTFNDGRRSCKLWVCNTDIDGSVGSGGRARFITLWCIKRCLLLESKIRAFIQGAVLAYLFRQHKQVEVAENRWYSSHTSTIIYASIR